jgi:hypothetical protein
MKPTCTGPFVVRSHGREGGSEHVGFFGLDEIRRNALHLEQHKTAFLT